MTKEPWLDGLTEDWAPDPVLPEESVQASSARLKETTRPSHLSKSRDTPRDSSASGNPELEAPAAPSTRPHPHPHPPLSRSPLTSDKRDSRSNTTNQFPQTQTVQVRHGNSATSDEPPEWRRRILQGESAGEGADLFAPLGLERMFEPPNDNKSVEPSNPSAHRTSHQPHQMSDSEQNNERLFAPASNVPTTKSYLPTHRRNTSGLGGRHGRQPNTDGRMRTASGVEEVRNEGFTPIPPPTGDESELEQVDSAEFSSIHITRDFYNRQTSSVTRGAGNSGNRGQSTAVEATPEMTSQSLPEGLSMGTQDASSLGGFVNTRRGGYSNEGSFLKRPLSPSSLPSQGIDSSLSSQVVGGLSQQKRHDEVSHISQRAVPRPATPPSNTPSADICHDDDAAAPEDTNGKRSVSPLKLFATHDTFTNDRLLRRMGQFEENLEEDADEIPLPQGNTQNGSTSHPPLQQISPNILNNIQADDSTNGTMSSSRTADRAKANGPLQKGPQPENADRSQPAAEWLKRQKLEPAETKRARNSPTKDSSPKRRRTLENSGSHHGMWHKPLLHSSEFVSHNDVENSDIDGFQEEESPDQSPSKRPASRDSAAAAALRPNSAHRTNAPSSRPFSRRAENGFSRPNTSHQPQDSNDERLGHAPRKGSITTQDFLDEATKIMEFIRTRGRLKTGLPDLVESDVENAEEPYGDESSEEEFSRPPSREMAHLPRLRVSRAPNPRIVSHLKKFEEDDDQDMFMGASAMSLRLRMAPASPRGLQKDDNDHLLCNEGTVRSNPDNVRIRKPFGKRTRRHSFSGETVTDNAAGLQSDFPSHRSIGGIPAGLSRNSTGSSGTKGIISSDMVSHLIPEKVGRMVFDRDEQRWVKGGGNQSGTNTQHPIGDVSEGDPFQSIPDLSVDELQELINARDFVPSQTTTTTTTQAEDRVQDGPNEEVAACQPPTESRPTTKDGASSVQTRSTRFTGSYPKPDTRATSWATEDFEQQAANPSKAETKTTTGGAPAAEVQHESRVHDGQMSPVASARRRDKMQPRAVTVNFSSPLASPTSDPADDEHLPAEEKLPSQQPHSLVKEGHPLPDLPVHTPMKRSTPAVPQRGSPGKRVLNGRPISRIDEQNEDSVEGEDVELSVVRHNDQSAIAHRTPGANLDTSYSFHLSPLADFTVNQADDSMRLEVSYVAERTNPKSLRQVHGTFALAAETLIKHITDVEPFEVYWEHLRELDLRGKGLITLLKLNQYCPRLEELNAANNRIGQLSGVPSEIRSLDVAGNCLSNLTAWAHLSNLQYVDVSGNELENLDGFSGLVHLRSLKANGNRIKSVGGLWGLDGLLSLELRNNALASVDFGGSELFRLKELDLGGNQLASVEHIDCLPSLETLDLRDNKLGTFKSDSVVPCLRSLRLSRNGMTGLDISSFPELRLLYVDVNHLSSIIGLDTCEHLDSLSMREQTCASDDGCPLTVDIDLGHMPALRKLYLSSNKLSPTTLAPLQSPAPDIQFLDLASCSLETLPKDFGATFPNIRGLNLNFNALAEMTGLHGITRLSRLSLVGNRVSRLRRLCQVLRDVGGKNGTLRKVDLRGNPITVGFYPAPLLGSGRRMLRLEGGKKSQEVVNVKRSSGGDDYDDDGLGLAPLDGCVDIAVRAGGDDAAPTALERRRELACQAEDDVEIDDPYTIPPADADADRRYLVHLDESTRLRRRVVELMMHAATSGRLKVLDGLDLTELEDQGPNGKRVRKDWVWHRLEELGVLKKRDLGASSSSSG